MAAPFGQDELIHWFLAAQDQLHKDIAEQANQVLNQQLTANPQNFPAHHMNVLVNVTHPIKVCHMASISVRSTIKDRNAEHLVSLREW
jgi:hypothetical protein